MAQRLMEIDVEARCGADTVERKIPKLRSGSSFREFLEPGRAAEKALTAVIQEADVHGISTRSVDDPVKALGMCRVSTSQVARLCGKLDEQVGASEAVPFWTDFLRSLNRRGLCGVKLVISDSHERIKVAVSKVLKATSQRCRVPFMRNALTHAGKTQRHMVAAIIGTVFV